MSYFMKRSQLILYILCLGSFLAITYGFGRYIFAQITPQIVESLHLDYKFIGLINACQMLTLIFASIVSGFLSVALGAKKVLSFAVILCALGMTSLYFLHGKWILLIVISVLGACATTSWVSLVVTIARSIPKSSAAKLWASFPAAPPGASS